MQTKISFAQREKAQVGVAVPRKVAFKIQLQETKVNLFAPCGDHKNIFSGGKGAGLVI